MQIWSVACGSLLVPTYIISFILVVFSTVIVGLFLLDETFA